MITYYLDNTTTRCIRGSSAGSITAITRSSTTTSGTAVAVDAINLQLTYDINNGVGNPGGVEMTATDIGTGGACSPIACAADADSEGQPDD